jgi:carbon-monoxide dehydrogenase large subunit
VVTGDTSVTPFGPTGSIAARSLAMGGGAVKLAAGKMREKLRRLAGHLLEVDADDLDLVDGRFQVIGAPERYVTVVQAAALAYSPSRLPPDEEPGLHTTGTYLPKGRPYSYGVHVVAVEVFPDTGRVEILKYVIVDDCGVVVNPMIVEGQLHGGMAQGLAAALYEELAYDADGQMLNASFMDYLVPTAMEVPPMTLGHLEIPSTITPGGFKGVGESGVVAPPPAIANAVSDALRPLGVQVDEIPITPARLWAAIRAADQLTIK